MKRIVKKKGKIIAFINWQRIGKPKHKLIEITRIEVNEAYRQEGLATSLFKRMLREIKFRKLFVTTHKSNSIAKRFYKSMGMKFETTLKNHYYKGLDECVYSMFRR